ncbi:MAG: ATP-binding protein [Ilumatobacteraceae bacterium]
MQRWRESSAEHPTARRQPFVLGATGIVAVGLVLGLQSERAAFAPEDLDQWIPDLVTGMVWIACGTRVLRRARPAASLMIATGLAWFAANVWPEMLFFHRGLIIHLLVSYPAWRPRSSLGLVGVILGYLSTARVGIWRDDLAAVALLIVIVIASVSEWHAASARQRRVRPSAMLATALFATVVAAQAIARSAFAIDSTSTALSLTYESMLCVVAVTLARSRANGDALQMADLVVELGEARSGTLRDALASALGDPTLRVGYWEQGSYIDLEGRTLSLPVGDPARAATYVGRGPERFAVLVHDVQVLAQPELVESVAAATRLSNANSELQREVREQLLVLAASRRRLLTAADEARRELDDRLRAGAERSLRELDDCLTDAAVAHPAAERLPRTRELLALTLDDLRRLALGLHPRALNSGLADAVDSLVAGMPLDVHVVIDHEPADVAVRTAIFFICAEALANTIKHAEARSVSIEVHALNGNLTLLVRDDGCGGATVGVGTGLRGLVDRVESLDGTMRIVSPLGGGTNLFATFPDTGESTAWQP